MSITQTILYDVAGNFTFDSSRIQIAASKASLKLGDNTGQTFQQTFASSSGFTYDATKAEFSGGTLRQLDKRPAGGTFGASFATSINGSWGLGSLTGTANGSAAISGGKLDLTGGGTRYVTFDGTDNVSQLGMLGAVNLRFTPNYDGIPTDNQIFLELRDTANPNNNLIQLFHHSNGSFFLLMNDENGTNILSNSVASYSAVSGQEIELELSWDLANNKVRMFGQGFLVADIDTTFTRSNTIDRIKVGPDSGGQFYLRDLIFYDDVQHTANYTAGEYTVPNGAYVESVVTLPTFTYSGVGELQAFTAFAATITGAPRFVLNGKYWNGSAWVNSDNTYAQSTSYANAVSNISSIAVAQTLVVKVTFPDGNTQGIVDLLTVTYTGQIYPLNNPAIVNTTTVGVEEIEGFSAVLSASGSDAVKFQLVIDGTNKYWTGSAWATSDGTYSQANTQSEINSNLASLDVSDGVTLAIRSLLHSGDGSTTPELTSVSINYDFYAPPPTPPNECICYAFARDILGDVASDSPVLVIERTAPLQHGQTMILPSRTEVHLDTEGRWETSLVETETVSAKYRFSVQFTDHNGNTQYAVLGFAAVPDEASLNLATLTFSAT